MRENGSPRMMSCKFVKTLVSVIKLLIMKNLNGWRFIELKVDGLLIS